MEESVFYLNPTEVLIHKDLPRFREEMGDVQNLAISIEQRGQIQPIVVDENNNLICGGRRLAACMLLNKRVLCRRLAETNPLVLRELELIENVERKDFTPAEKAKAIAEIHSIQEKLKGTACPGSTGGQTLDQTAQILGVSRRTVTRAIEAADMIDKFPELQECKSDIAIRRAAEGLARRLNAAEKSAVHAKLAEDHATLYQVFHQDFRTNIKLIPDKSIDIIITDPVYGIAIDTIARGGGTSVGKVSTTGSYYDDNKENALKLIETLANESIRITKSTSHGYVFVSPENFQAVRSFFVNAGWEAYIKPLIWIKRASGQTNHPTKWPASCYEMILYIRRENACLIKEGMPDWMECPPLTITDKTYPSEKPVPLIQQLLKRVAIPTNTAYDPFMGSGALLEAGLRERLIVQGCDISKEAYGLALIRLVATQKELFNNK